MHSLEHWVALTPDELFKLERGDPVLLHLREYDAKATECEDWDFMDWKGRFLLLGHPTKFLRIVDSANVGKLKIPKTRISRAGTVPK